MRADPVLDAELAVEHAQADAVAVGDEHAGSHLQRREMEA